MYQSRSSVIAVWPGPTHPQTHDVCKPGRRQSQRNQGNFRDHRFRPPTVRTTSSINAIPDQTIPYGFTEDNSRRMSFPVGQTGANERLASPIAIHPAILPGSINRQQRLVLASLSHIPAYHLAQAALGTLSCPCSFLMRILSLEVPKV